MVVVSNTSPLSNLAIIGRLVLRFIGVLGVLLRAKKGGQVASLREEIRRLREEARFFVARTLEVELLKAAEE